MEQNVLFFFLQRLNAIFVSNISMIRIILKENSTIFILHVFVYIELYACFCIF